MEAVTLGTSGIAHQHGFSMRRASSICSRSAASPQFERRRRLCRRWEKERQRISSTRSSSKLGDGYGEAGPCNLSSSAARAEFLLLACRYQNDRRVVSRVSNCSRGLSLQLCHASLPSSASSDSQEKEVVLDGEVVKEEEGEELRGGAIQEKGKNAAQSSWDAKDLQGNDYLYMLGKESANLNITVGARAGMIDDIFVGDFLGVESDIVFKYRQKVTRSFEHLQGDYYIAPVFLDKIVTHIVKNYLAPKLEIQVPLILGVWGGKGQGKSFQIELICKAMGLEPVIMSAGELESEWAGAPGRLIRDRYRTASQVIKNQASFSSMKSRSIQGIGS